MSRTLFERRRIESDPSWSDADGIKLYTVSPTGAPLDRRPYLDRLAEVKASKAVDWNRVAAFAVLHEGAAARYLVLCWWAQENELLTCVSVEERPGEWTCDPDRHSFCVWDLEILWAERNLFLETVYTTEPDLAAYRARFFRPPDGS